MSEWDGEKTKVDIWAGRRAREDHETRMAQQRHRANWELEELQASWIGKATNYSDDFVEIPTTEIRR